MAVYLEQDADLHMAQLMPLPLTVSCYSKSILVLPKWFCFSGASLPRFSWKKAVKPMYVCVCALHLQDVNAEQHDDCL